MGIERGDLDAAMAAWRGLLGDARVVAEAELGGYGESTLANAPRPAAAIKVASSDEVIAAVRIANECGVPLYPISRGKNWGYGDACPAAPGQVILDLSAMDRIVEVDPDLAYAVVEPGVTQQQLHDHLEREGYPLWFPCTASAPDTSVIGNLVERGVGSTPYSDHAAHACDMEVVLGDGTLIETGLGRYPGSLARNTYRWGVGPHLDGLFAQSNLGIVVRAAVWLMPRSEEVVAFTLTMERDEQIAEVIERLRKLRLEGTLRAPVFIENGYRALANRGAYPWAAMREATPLPPNAVRQLLGASPIAAVNGPWNAFGSIYGTKRAVAAAMKDAEDGLAGLGTLRFTSEARLERTERLGRVLGALRLRRGKQLAAMAKVARAGMQPLKGVPSAAGMSVSRWRLRRDASGLCEDPTAEGCGLYWLAPVCPAKGAEVRRCTELIEREMLAAGFEPLIRVAFTGDRAVFVTTLLCFDRDDTGQADRADRLHRDLTALLIEEGYPPYRSAITTMGLLDPDGSTYWTTVEALREALDPNRVIAPGRYEPGAALGQAEPRPAELDGQKV
jgi:4-cresol dehydrogenase (hydroxylating)